MIFCKGALKHQLDLIAGKWMKSANQIGACCIEKALSIFGVCSRSCYLMDYFGPLQLTAPPVNTRVLAFLSAVAGDALTRHLGVILPALLSSLKGKLGSEECLQVNTTAVNHSY